MTQINPFMGSIVQASDVQRLAATDKDRQLQRAADKRKDSGATGDRFEHAVESSEELAAIHDEEKDNPNKKRDQDGHHQNRSDDDDADSESGLDLTA